jgi:ribosomal protein S18 acetylase RimI-like enzyme
MQDVKLVRAGAADIDMIAKLAKIIWNQHYPAIISQQQIDYMLEMMYSRQSLVEQFEKKKHSFFLVEHFDNYVGFISVNPEVNNNWFLGKFYIDQTTRGKGLGHKAFNLLLEEIKPSQITLTVNRQNFKSINFYFKLGFKIERVADFDIGNGFVMNDFVMKWKNIEPRDKKQESRQSAD